MCLLATTAEQHHNGLAVLDVVDTPARTEMDSQLAQSLADRSGVTRKPVRKALEPCEYGTADSAVLEAREPVRESWQGLERIHPRSVVDR